MVFRKPKFASWLTLSAFVLLAFGLGLTVFSTQQQQDTRTRASTEPNPNECNTQYGNASNPRCCSKSYTGGMCKYTNQACPGGFIPQTSSYTSWYCPGGNDYRCCKNAAPSANAGSDKTITLPTNSVTISGSCSDADSDSRNLKSCKWTKETNLAGTIENPSSGSTKVSGLVQGKYTFKLTASDGYATATDTMTVTVNAAPAPKDTTFSLDLLLHGIANAGDNVKSPGPGNFDPQDKTRTVKVEVRDINNGPVVVTKEGQVTYNSASGSYKGTIDMGSGLTNKAYDIRIKLTHSLWRQTPRTISAGQPNTIPQVTLENGDTNNDGLLNIADYNIIRDCYFDEDIGTPAKNCNSTKKQQADIDDDGDVNHFDLSLFLREMSVQD